MDAIESVHGIASVNPVAAGPSSPAASTEASPDPGPAPAPELLLEQASDTLEMAVSVASEASARRVIEASEKKASRPLTRALHLTRRRPLPRREHAPVAAVAHVG